MGEALNRVTSQSLGSAQTPMPSTPAGRPPRGPSIGDLSYNWAQTQTAQWCVVSERMQARSAGAVRQTLVPCEGGEAKGVSLAGEYLSAHLCPPWRHSEAPLLTVLVPYVPTRALCDVLRPQAGGMEEAKGEGSDPCAAHGGVHSPLTVLCCPSIRPLCHVPPAHNACKVSRHSAT